MNKHIGSLLYGFTLTTALVAASCSKAPAPPSTMPAAPAAVGNVSDVDVTERVKTALLNNELLKGQDINVVTLKGDVRLTGVMDTQMQIDEALKTARVADGAHTVHDELTIKK